MPTDLEVSTEYAGWLVCVPTGDGGNAYHSLNKPKITARYSRTLLGNSADFAKTTIKEEIMGRSRYRVVDPRLPHFVTCTVLHWIPVFTRPETVDILFDSLRFLMRDGLRIYAYVILENHLHLVVQSEQLEKDMARFKTFTAKRLIQYLNEHRVDRILQQLAFYKKAHKADRAYQFWQEGIHPEWIQNAEMMRQKVEYIHQNPVKRGYVDLPEQWRYSSARNYLGQDGLLDVFMAW